MPPIIAYDAKRAFHNHRGLGNYSRDVIRLMAKYHPEFEYVLFNPKKVKEGHFYSPPPLCRVVSPSSLIYSAFPALWRSYGIKKDLRTIRPKIYHGLSQELPFSIHKTKIPTVVTVHDAIFMRFPQLYSALYRAMFIRKNRYAAKHASLIIAISEQTRRDFIEYFGADESKIRVVYQGCNNIFHESIREEQRAFVRKKYALPERFCVQVGAIEPRKNIDKSLLALRIAKTEMPFVIIGKPTTYLKKEIMPLIEKLGLVHQVKILSDVPTSDLPAIYSMADFSLYPSSYEGFGIPILESLAVGRPVITSEGSCFPETAGDAALYCETDSAESLAEQITKAQSTALLDSLAAKAAAQVLKFQDESIVKGLFSVYEELL